MTSVKDVVEGVLSHRGLDLEGLSQVRAGSRIVLRITVDGDGDHGTGLTLDDVADVSKAISVALDDSAVMGEKPYVLEVGTPGVDRPLTTQAHWRRNIGRLVRVKVDGSDPLVARIEAVSDDAVQLSGGVRLLFADVSQAVVQVEMNRDEEKEE